MRRTIPLLQAALIVGLAAVSSIAETTSQITLRPSEHYVTAALYDPVHDTGYFAVSESNFRYTLEMASATIVRVRLSDFRRTGTLSLKSGENAIASGLVDPMGTFAYFGVYGDPNRDVSARLVKVDLLTFTREEAASLGKEEYGISSSLLGKDGRTSYWGTLYGSIVAVHLPEMVPSAALVLQREENAFLSGALDSTGTFAYFGTASGNVMKIQLADFIPVGNLNVFESKAAFQTILLDPLEQSLFLATQDKPSRIVRLALDKFRPRETIELMPGETPIVFAFFEPAKNTATFITGGLPASLVTVNLSPLERIGHIELPKSLGKVQCGFYSPNDHAVFLGMGDSPAQIIKLPYPP